MTLASGKTTGCLLGLAIGDALGTTTCMLERDRHPPVTKIIGGGPFNLPAGYWTDDTAMALALADSLLVCDGFNPADVMDRWCCWLETGEYSSTGKAFDVGKTIFRALMHYKRTKELYGFVDPRAGGNGAIMRLAPVVIRYLPEPDMLRQVVIDQTRLTHPSELAIEASLLLSEILALCMAGVPKAYILDEVSKDYQTDIAAIAAGTFLAKNRDQIQSDGYVPHTLEAALWCFFYTESFREALIKAVNLCGDADTVGAVTGQIAGAYYGETAIPEEWLALLHCRQDIVGKAVMLTKVLEPPIVNVRFSSA